MKSKVFYSKNDFTKIIKLLPKNLKGKTGLKVHVGEMGCETYLNPDYVKAVYNELQKTNSNVSMIECNVLYRGSRTNQKDHLETAKSHGFDFAPLDICDGEQGNDDWEIIINQKHFDSIFVGKNLQDYQNMITISHFKGHGGNGFGGALKNIGMGLGSRKGKMAMHSAFNLTIDKNLCVGCSTCAKKCNANAIEIINEKAHIDFTKCIRCAGCIANCPLGAVQIPWGDGSAMELQERIVEYCYGIIKKINSPFYINVLENITPLCDCYGVKQKTISDNLGFLASTDPIAIDQASFDILNKTLNKDIFQDLHKIDATRQLSYGQELKLGRRDYELIKI